MEYFTYLSERFKTLKIEKDFPFSSHSTIGCGGYAAVCVYPEKTEDAEELLGFLARERIPYCFLGAGANVLPSDNFFDGVVVRFSAMNSLLLDGTLVHAGAGVTGGMLCRLARMSGVSGFETFTGIPMTLGGGVTMNAGVAEGHFSDVVERVTAVEKGRVVHFSNKDCGFSEKESIFQSGIAVTEIVLRGRSLPRREIEQRTAYFRAKRAHLPKGRSMGCTFVNPNGVSAGRLIEDCGLKGYRIGGAEVSEQHANFIINDGGTAEDIVRLIDVIKRRVKERTGILLREEIRRIVPNT